MPTRPLLGVLIVLASLACSSSSTSVPPGDAASDAPSEAEVAPTACLGTALGFTCPRYAVPAVAGDCTSDDLDRWVATKCTTAPCTGLTATTACQKCLQDWTATSSTGTPGLNTDACLVKWAYGRDCVEARRCVDACIDTACAACADAASKEACAREAVGATGPCRGRADSLSLLKCDAYYAKASPCSVFSHRRILDYACRLDGVTPKVLTMIGSAIDMPRGGVPGATITTFEDPTIVATSAGSGYALKVPNEIPLTFTVTAPGYVRTIAQTRSFHADLERSFRVLTTADFATIQALGGAPAGTALVEVHVTREAGCLYEGGLVSISPSSGKTFYPALDMSLTDTSLHDGTLSFAMFTGVTAPGSVTPSVRTATCKGAPFPLVTPQETFYAPQALLPDTFYELTTDLAP